MTVSGLHALPRVRRRRRCRRRRPLVPPAALLVQLFLVQLVLAGLAARALPLGADGPERRRWRRYQVLFYLSRLNNCRLILKILKKAFKIIFKTWLKWNAVPMSKYHLKSYLITSAAAAAATATQQL